MLSIIPLGTAGWIPTDTRSTSAFLCEVEDQLIILDAGTGLYKLRNYAHILEKYTTIHLILSHYHLDHIIGLCYLPRFTAGKELHLYGPGAPWYPEGCRNILEQFTSPPYFSESISHFAREVHFHDYTPNGFTIGTVRIGIVPQLHTQPSFGITLGNYLHYATDTSVIEESFNTQAKLLFHECWAKNKEQAGEHSSLEEIKKMLQHKKVEKVGLIHLHPFLSEAEWESQQSSSLFPVVENQEIRIESH